MNRTFQSLFKIFQTAPNLLQNLPITECGYQNFKFFKRNHSGTNQLKVTVVGALGKIGQPLCLMLKQSPLIDELCMHDVKATAAFAMELNHVDTNCRVTAFTGSDNLPFALENSKVVVIVASAPEVNALTLEKLWLPNAHVVSQIVTQIGSRCPKAFVAIGTNPINSLVPMACEILRKGSAYSPSMVFGVTTINTVRANTFAAQVLGIDPECVSIPVIGGHSEETITPVLSQAKPCSPFTNEELENITTSIRKAHDNIIKLKPPETAPLCNAFSVARFVISLIKAIRGYPDIVEPAYVQSQVHPQLKYLSTDLLLGPNGIVKNMGIPKLSDFESCIFDNAISSLASDIKKGEKFVGVESRICNPCDPNPNSPRCPANWC